MTSIITDNTIHSYTTTYEKALVANDDNGASNTLDISSLHAREIVGAFGQIKGGLTSGAFQGSFRIVNLSITSVTIQTVATISQIYFIEVTVLYRI